MVLGTAVNNYKLTDVEQETVTAENASIEYIRGVDPKITVVNTTGMTTYVENMTNIKDDEGSNTKNERN